MKREEEINNYAKKASEELYDSLRQNGLDILTSRSFQYMACSYIARGAKWADRTMLNAACDYLESVEIDRYLNATGSRLDFDYERFVNDFRQTMKDV